MNSADATLRARVCVHACAYLFVCVCVRVYVRLNVKAHARCIYQPLGLRWGVCVCVCVHACLFVHVCVCVCVQEAVSDGCSLPSSSLSLKQRLYQ